MKKRFLLSSAALGVLSALSAYFLINDSDVQAQNAARVVNKTVSAKKTEEPSSKFARAAFQNSRLRSSLQWAFGGKTHTGWNIYLPLISSAIGADSLPDSAEFALSISKWQESSGLPGTGVIDRETLESFTKYWQSRRLGRPGLLSTETLTSAPINEFFDSSRSPELLQVESETFAAYKRMVAGAAKELRGQLITTSPGQLAPSERFLKIISSYRSPAYQESLRQKEPNAGRAALAKNSPHSTGHALDIYVGGEPVKTDDANRLLQVQTPVYKWLVSNAEKFGFYPYFYEPWHWEYVPRRANS